MGCCHSRAASESPYGEANAPGSEHNAPNDSSRAAINRPSQAPDARSNTSREPQINNAGASRRPDGTIVRPNQPLQAPRPVGHCPKYYSHHQPPWTRRILEDLRKEFFDTRTSNRREIWDALEIVTERMRAGDLDQAQAVLDAAGLTVPNGRLARGAKGRERSLEGVYDDRGKLYDIPYWIVADPADIIEGGDEKDIDNTEDDEDVDSASRREEKGKGRAEDIGDEMRVTARLNTAAQDVTVTIGTKQTILVLKRKIEQQNNIKLNKLIHLGKILKDHQTLESTGWKSGQILNAFVDDRAVTEHSTA
ncbi:hypothetical protein CB0940_00738 [Cercospora beticola]|uniref:Ubiquitin-like domain-containing protein n=1 Tax=Cercospora beticola TaxID=122368 RepID=A0A2G5I888_CERBT|nr:hypothetical protein CB0940_00738 [Cercospora beticola]PIB01011.1 hypothetical protein CB0940_00738 [Cercospora beticola]WPA96166.1 hypothetical protein RHO25_000772 [Cercospora beticola]CAK1355547.1 unnamed protein product [Cercospora beticola]